MKKEVSALEMGVLISLVLLLGIGIFLGFMQPEDAILEMLLIVLISVQLVSLAILIRKFEENHNI